MLTKKQQELLVEFRRIKQSSASKSIISSMLSIFIGIFVGFIIMLFAMIFTPGSNAFEGLGIIFSGPFAGAAPLQDFGNMLFYTIPLVFTGLSVALAYKTGLFNIGAPGQFYMGTMVSLLIALNIDNNGNRVAGVFVWILALVCGIMAGMIWGTLAGLFKGLFNINEVIVCIMLNWIAANIVSWVFSSTPWLTNASAGKSGYLITTGMTGNYTPQIGLDKLFSYGSTLCYLDIGIIFAMISCVLVFVLMQRTVTGYSLKATGSNRNAAKYAGINDRGRIILSLTIAGGLAAAGGCLLYLNRNIEFVWNSAYQNLPAYGFNGIPVALLANSNPLAVFFSAIFIRYLTSGGTNLVSAGFNKYFADIIIAVIIYLSGFTRFFKSLVDKFSKKKDEFYAKKGLDYLIIKDEDINAEDAPTPPQEEPAKEEAEPVAEETPKEEPETKVEKPKPEVSETIMANEASHENPQIPEENKPKVNPFKKFFRDIKDYFIYLDNKYIKRKKDPLKETLEPENKEEGGDK